MADETDEEPVTSTAKPRWPEYSAWLQKLTGDDAAIGARGRYETVGLKIRNDVEVSDFWTQLLGSLRNIGDEYTIDTGYQLFANSDSPQLHLKPYNSIMDKTFRKNVLGNQHWPDPPENGWITPQNWFNQLNDVVRTTLVVKYLDGVEFLVDRLRQVADRTAHDFAADFEARDEGYYAAHCYVRFDIEIPKVNWDTERVSARLELQVTTQLQDVIRKLTHDYYENRRSKVRASKVKWQWDYGSPEFVPNYLGHILHYLEGMIMDVRNRRNSQ